MKRLYIFILSLVAVAGLSAQVADDPVLMTVNGKDILRSEFEYAFNKNRGNISDSAMTAEEYLQMYIDFKLKVAEAEELRIDTLESFRTEYAKDRSQLAESYLTDPDYVGQHILHRSTACKYRQVACYQDSMLSRHDRSMAQAEHPMPTPCR